jgi:uncharacterized membrane protein
MMKAVLFFVLGYLFKYYDQPVWNLFYRLSAYPKIHVYEKLAVADVTNVNYWHFAITAVVLIGPFLLILAPLLRLARIEVDSHKGKVGWSAKYLNMYLLTCAVQQL